MHQGFSKFTLRRNLTFLLVICHFCTMASTLLSPAWAETWVCPRPGQADLYTDREYPGCRQLGDGKTYSPLTVSPASKAPPSRNLSPSVANPVLSEFSQQPSWRKPLPFSDVTLSLPLLSVGQDRVGAITGSWRGYVRNLPLGTRLMGRGRRFLETQT